jgi:glutamyl-tRNA synthetase
LLSKIGTTHAPEIRKTLQELAQEFDLASFGRAPANYDEAELVRLNHKYLAQLSFEEVRPQLALAGLEGVDERFWLAVRPNLSRLAELGEWWDICCNPLVPVLEDAAFLERASHLLPEGEWDEATWGQWTAAIRDVTGRKGKDLFMPLRRALTGKDHGPELKALLPLIGRSTVENRLHGVRA